jgi:hypothetical protein
MDVTLRNIEAINSKGEWEETRDKMVAALNDRQKRLWKYFSTKFDWADEDYEFNIIPRLLFYMLRDDYMRIRELFWNFDFVLDKNTSQLLDTYYFTLKGKTDDTHWDLSGSDSDNSSE